MKEQGTDVLDRDRPTEGDETEKVMRIEVEIEDREPPALLEMDKGSVASILKKIRETAELDDLFVFEHDKGEPVGKEIEKRKALRLVAHRSKVIAVTIQFEHREENKKFPPSATILRVLQWAIKAFRLDPTQASKANLILPGADTPLPKDSVIGRYVRGKDGKLTLVLTLKDFTNG